MKALWAWVVLSACSDADFAEPQGPQGPSAGGSPAGQPPQGEPGAAPGEGGPPPAPGPPPAMLEEPGAPATFLGGSASWVAGRAGQPWAAIGRADEQGTAVTWWNRATGEHQPAAKGPPGMACAVGEGLVCVGGGEWKVAAFPGGQAPALKGKAPSAATDLAIAPGGWIALLGDPLVIVDPAGKVAWSEPGPPIAAGWFGDTLWYARDGNVREVEPVDGSVREVGALPATADSWKVAPDGTWAARQGQTLLLFGPGLIGMTDVKPPMVKLPPATGWYGWFDAQHLVVTTPTGLHLWERRRPVALGGDLAEKPTPELLRPFAP